MKLGSIILEAYDQEIGKDVHIHVGFDGEGRESDDEIVIMADERD